MKKLSLLVLGLALLSACSNSNSASNAAVGTDSVQTLNNKDEASLSKDSTNKTGILSLWDAFESYLQSNAYHGVFDYETFSERDEENTELIKTKENNDFFKFQFTAPFGREDSLTFHLIKSNPEYNIYVFQGIGHSESPQNFYNELYLAKLDKNTGKWNSLPLSKEKIDGKELVYYLGFFAYYSPENKTITNYYAEDDPNTALGEVKGSLKDKFKWSDEQEGFVNMNVHANKNTWPNPVVVKGNVQYILGEHVNSLLCQIDHSYYHDEGKYKDTKYLIYQYQIPGSMDWTEIDTLFEREVINNKDTTLKFMIKYKEKDDEYYIEDYEIIGKSPVIATFKSFEAADFNYYGFTSRLGYKYYFNDIADGSYTYPTLENENGEGPNPKYLGKKFKISFHTEEVENNVDGGTFQSVVIDKIELINN